MVFLKFRQLLNNKKKICFQKKRKRLIIVQFAYYSMFFN